MDEEAYKKELAEAGVDLPELKEEETPQTPEEPQKEEPKEEPLQEPKEQRKRSIYDEYKEKKAELKSEREAREQAERERDEFRTKLEAYANAPTEERRIEAQDDLDAFAKEINADPASLRKMRDLFLKDAAPTNKQLETDLAEFKAWKAQNAQFLEQQMFEKEFKAVTPTIKDMFGNIADTEMDAIRSKLDELSHTKEWHDKDLDYIVFKNKQELSALVSPKKRSMETKSRRDVDTDTFEFDAEADLSKMTPKQLEQWEEAYRKAGKQADLLTDAQGRKMII